MPVYSKSTVATIFLLVLFSPLAIDIYLPALPLLSDELGVNNTLAQDTISYFVFTLGLGQLITGPLADRFGRRLIALVGIVIYGLCALLAWYATTIEAMLVARLLQGIGACATSVAAFAATRDLFGPIKSARMISYLNGAICFIPALAPILGSWLTLQFGWRSNFSFMFGFAIVCFCFVILKFKETRPENTMVSGSTFSLSRYYSVLKQPVFLFHASLCLLAMAVILAYVTSAPNYLMQELGLSMSQFTFWFTLNAIFNISASFIAPKLMDKLGIFKALTFGVWTLICAGVLMLILSSFKTPAAFMIPIIFSSIGFALVLGASAGLALAPFGDRAGTAAALLGVFQMSGSSLLIVLLHRLSLSSTDLLSLQMLLLLPWAAVLHSRWIKHWYQDLKQ